jgi:hypothetical protein
MAEPNVFDILTEPLIAHLLGFILKDNPTSAVRLRRSCKRVHNVVRNRPELIAYAAWRINLIEAHYDPEDSASSELALLWTQYAFRCAASMVEQSRQATSHLMREGMSPSVAISRRSGRSQYGYQEGAPDELYSGILDWEVTVPYSLENLGVVFQPSLETMGFPYRNTYTSYFELTIKRERLVGGGYPLIGFALPGLKKIPAGGPPCAIVLTLTGQPHLYVASNMMHVVTEMPIPSLGDVVGLGITKTPSELLSSSWLNRADYSIANAPGDFQYAVFVTLNGKLMHTSLSPAYPYQLNPFVNYHNSGGVDLVNISGSPKYPWTYNIYKHIDSFPYFPITDAQEGADKFAPDFHPLFLSKVKSQTILVPTFHSQNSEPTNPLLQDAVPLPTQDEARDAPATLSNQAQSSNLENSKVPNASSSSSGQNHDGSKAKKGSKKAFPKDSSHSASSALPNALDRPSWLWLFYLQHGIHPEPTAPVVQVQAENVDLLDSEVDEDYDDLEPVNDVVVSNPLTEVSVPKEGTVGLQEAKSEKPKVKLAPLAAGEELSLDYIQAILDGEFDLEMEKLKKYEGLVISSIEKSEIWSTTYIGMVNTLAKGKDTLTDAELIDTKARMGLLFLSQPEVYLSTYLHVQFMYRVLMCTNEYTYFLMHHCYIHVPEYDDPTFFPKYKIWEPNVKTTIEGIHVLADRVQLTPTITRAELNVLLKRYGWLEAVPLMADWPRAASELASMVRSSAGMAYLFTLAREVATQLANESLTETLWIPRELWMSSRLLLLFIVPDYTEILRELPPLSSSSLLQTEMAFDRYRRLKTMGFPKVPFSLLPVIPFWKTLFPAITLMRGLYKWKYSLTTQEMPAYAQSLLLKFGAQNLKLRYFVVHSLLALPFSIVPPSDDLDLAPTLVDTLVGLYEARRIIRSQYPQIKQDLASFCQDLAATIFSQDHASKAKEASTATTPSTSKPQKEAKDPLDNTTAKEKASALLWLFGDVPEINDTFDIFLPTPPLGSRISNWIYNFIW